MDTNIVVEDWASRFAMFTLLAMAVAFLLGSVMPRRPLAGKMQWRWVNNLSLGLISWLTGRIAAAGFLLWLARWTELSGVGLLQAVGAGPLLAFLILLLVSQLSTYIFHVAFHRIPWLWRLHAVHHSDIDVDVTTAYRNHPFEALISLPFTAPLVVVLGAPMVAVAAYQFFNSAVTVFSHSNIYVPPWLDRCLRLVVVTPDFHRLHHCAEQRYTNSNYGNAVPWFDYLFGSHSQRPAEDQKTMTLGLEYFREPRFTRLDRMLALPLYWRQRH